MNETAILIDGANLHASIKELKMRIDFDRLRNWLDDRYDVPLIQYYTALYADADNNGHIEIKNLIDWLNYNGYRIISKPAKKMGKVIKGNMDIEIALDAIQLAHNGVRRIVLFTGDGDFAPLVSYLQKRGVWVVVISTKETAYPMVADELRKQCDAFIELKLLAEHICSDREIENNIEPV